MADMHSKEVRSYNMSCIRGKDTAPEMLVRRYLHRSGFRYTLHSKNLPGKPDIVLPKYKSIIFVHGCFWHGHQLCKYYSLPKTNTMWWWDKINKNRANDAVVMKALKKEGWHVMEIWGCQLKKISAEKSLSKLVRRLNEYDPAKHRAADAAEILR